MAEYQYKCRGCRLFFTTLDRDDISPCPVCATPATRHFAFNIGRSIPEHFNNSTGTYVSNERELRDQLKMMSDEESGRIGMDHEYTYLSPSDMMDAEAHGVTEEGLDTTHRTWHDARVNDRMPT